jgi:hypothetical protein
MPARVGVVAHVGHAVRGQVLAADGEDLLLHGPGDPGEDAVADDVVELAQPGVDVEEAPRLQIQVLQAELCHEVASGLDLPRGEVDPHEAAFRHLDRHGYEVAAIRATQLQHPAAVRRSRLQAVEDRQGGEVVRMRPVLRSAGIGDAVIGLADGVFVLARLGDGFGIEQHGMSSTGEVEDIPRLFHSGVCGCLQPT